MDQFILKGPEFTNPVPHESIASFIRKYLVENINNGEVYADAENNRSLTYAEFFTRVCRCADALKSLGIGKNSLVTISSENDVNYFIPVFAALYVGASVVPINFLYTEFEIDHSLKTVTPNIIFCSSNSVDSFLALRAKYPGVKKIVIIDTDERIDGTDALNAFIDDNSSPNLDPIKYQPTLVNPDEDVAFIMFSSGTTGLPKAVMLTHTNFNTRISLQFEPTIIREIQSQNVIGILPFFHAYGLSMAMGTPIAGKKMIVFKFFDPLTYLKAIQDYQVEVLFAVPPLMHFLAKSPVVDEFDLSCVKEILCGGGALTESVENAVKRRLKVEAIRQGFGMTETTLGVTTTPVGVSRPGSCGKLLPGCSGIVRDPYTGKLMGPNATGELCFKGGVIMKGYYNNEKATRETFTDDGWLRTGDIGYYDADGYFYIVDRLKELIKYKGFQVAPSELEGILMTNKKIVDCAVVGLPDERDGELPVAFVVKENGVTLTERDVKTYLGNFVSKRKHLHGGVIFIDEIPKNPSGKILRRELRELLKNRKSKL